MNFAADAYLFYAIAVLATVLAGVGAWIAEFSARPARASTAQPSCRRRPARAPAHLEPVWVFNNIPAASRVDTEVSANAARSRPGGAA